MEIKNEAGKTCIDEAFKESKLENISNEFLLQYLSSQKYFGEVNTCLAGGTRQRISRSNLADFDIPVPAQKQEQQAIGHFFRNLDNLITLHQRECIYLFS